MATREYLTETVVLTRQVDIIQIDLAVQILKTVRTDRGTVFCIGNGGGAAHASHMAADLRKIGRIEAVAWGDNTADLTAWVNDDSWKNAVSRWIGAARPTKQDALFLFSVGGGGTTTSANLMEACRVFPGQILGVVGYNPDGFVQKFGCPVVILPTSDTCQVEGLQAVVAHCIVEQLR